MRHQPFGAQLLGARISLPGVSRELLFLSARSLGPREPVRGGVPVMFPQFNELGPLPRHGLVRTASWRASATGFTLDLDPATDPRWPHSARLALHARGSGSLLEIVLEAENTGTRSFEWSGGLHPYFAVDDLRVCTLQGLVGCALTDRYDRSTVREQQPKIRWRGDAFERLYDGAAPLELDAVSHRLRLSANGFDQWMVWNPGGQLSQSIADLGPGDWRRFICIEPVRVSRPNRLDPGERFVGSLRVEFSER